MPYTSEEHQQVASQMPRDNEGHFTPKPQQPISQNPTLQPQPASPQNPISKFISRHTDIKQDDLLDVHIGNPLKKITSLLEEIKKQKAFSFTVKGSLGVMGIVLVLSTFGILGGNRLLCDKGRQTHSGILHILTTKDIDASTIPLIGNLLLPVATKTHNRVVLEPLDQSTLISIPYNKDITIAMYNNVRILITGNYDSCSQILTPNSAGDVEVYK